MKRVVVDVIDDNVFVFVVFDVMWVKWFVQGFFWRFFIYQFDFFIVVKDNYVFFFNVGNNYVIIDVDIDVFRIGKDFVVIYIVFYFVFQLIFFVVYL